MVACVCVRVCAYIYIYIYIYTSTHPISLLSCTARFREKVGSSVILCLEGLTEWEFLFWGSSRRVKRRRCEAAIAEGKKPFTTKGSGGAGDEKKKKTLQKKGGGGAWETRAGGGGGAPPEADVILNISSQNGVHFRI